MAEQMSDAAAQRVKALCCKVAVANGLDEQIQRELCGHMEDELLAYLSGRQRLSEDDAMILVEKHFGDPAVVRGLLREVHSVDSSVSVVRRLLGVAVVWGIGAVATSLAWGASGWTGGGRAMGIFGGFLAGALGPILLWAAGIWWTRRAKRGLTPWFDRMPMGVLVSLCLLLPVLFRLAQWAAIHFSSGPGASLVQVLPAALALAWQVLVNAAILAAWAWWSDWPGLGTRRAAFGAAACAGWTMLLSLAWTVADVLLFGSYMPHVRPMQMIWDHILWSGSFSVICGTAGLSGYWLAARLARRVFRVATH